MACLRSRNIQARIHDMQDLAKGVVTDCLVPDKPRLNHLSHDSVAFVPHRLPITAKLSSRCMVNIQMVNWSHLQQNETVNPETPENNSYSVLPGSIRRGLQSIGNSRQGKKCKPHISCYAIKWCTIKRYVNWSTERGGTYVIAWNSDLQVR